MRSLDYARDDVKGNNSRHRAMQRNAPNTSSRLERSGMERSHTFALAKVNVSQIHLL